MKMTSGKVQYCYDLMDTDYDVEQIWRQSSELWHVPIIDRNPRKGVVLPMAPHEARRYNERSVAERFNSRLKEEFGWSQCDDKRSGQSDVTPDVWSHVTFCRSPAETRTVLISQKYRYFCNRRLK